MWLCTKLGFFSIVRKTPTEVHIRARAEHDLENLRRACGWRIPGAPSWRIFRSEPADYRFRIVIAPDQLAEVMTVLAASLDYSNFKGVIAGTPDQRDKLGIYSDFHHDLQELQNWRPPCPRSVSSVSKL